MDGGREEGVEDGREGEVAERREGGRDGRRKQMEEGIEERGGGGGRGHSRVVQRVFLRLLLQDHRDVFH